MKLETSPARESVLHKENSNIRMYVHDIDMDYPPHWHTDIEIVYPIAGTYKINCGSRSYFLEEGDILLICPAVIHEIFNTTHAGTRIYVQADFSKTISLREIESAFRNMSPALHISAASCPPEIYHALCEYIYDMYRVYFGTAHPVAINEGRIAPRLMPNEALEPYGEVEIYSILMNFITLCGRNLDVFQQAYPKTQAESSRNKIPLSNACEYISDHFTEKITLEDIASYAGFSKYHFARIFNDYTGETFYQYLQQKRISFAQTLLTNPTLSVTDIAYQAGFASSTAFARAFHKSTGYTPTQFRLLNEEQHPLNANKHFAHLSDEPASSGDESDA